MPAYTHVLAAFDINEEGHHILSRAWHLAKSFGARLSVIHVVEYFPSTGVVTAPIDLSEDRAIKARDTLRAWGREMGSPEPECQVVIGNPTTEVLRAADTLKVDLLIIGHHPHRGLSLLVSHTDAAVLNRASCDVLAVAHKKQG